MLKIIACDDDVAFLDRLHRMIDRWSTETDTAVDVALVTRGEDLFAATDVHRLLQALLGLPTPRYRHHPLMRDASGRRYAKRDKALTLRALRQAGKTPQDVRSMVGLGPLSG